MWYLPKYKYSKRCERCGEVAHKGVDLSCYLYFLIAFILFRSLTRSFLSGIEVPRIKKEIAVECKRCKNKVVLSAAVGFYNMSEAEKSAYKNKRLIRSCYATGYVVCFLLHIFFVVLIGRISGIVFDTTLSTLSVMCVVYGVLCLHCRKRVPIKRL